MYEGLFCVYYMVIYYEEYFFYIERVRNMLFV